MGQYYTAPVDSIAEKYSLPAAAVRELKQLVESAECGGEAMARQYASPNHVGSPRVEAEMNRLKQLTDEERLAELRDHLSRCTDPWLRKATERLILMEERELEGRCQFCGALKATKGT